MQDRIADATQPDGTNTGHDASAMNGGDAPPGAQDSPPQGTPIEPHRITFSGDGGIYFGVWIVNVILTIVTLGLYTPWARRRTIRYFYGHTEVAGTPLEFTAGIRSMVVGFLLFAGIYIAMEVAGNTGHNAVVGVILIGGALLAPWLWGTAMRFRLAHTRWRGLRLRFRAPWGEVYRNSWPVFAIAAVWLAATFALGQMIDAKRAAEGQSVQAPQSEPATLARLALPVAPGTTQESQAGTTPDAAEEEDPDTYSDEDEEALDEDTAADDADLDPLPRPTWAMGGVVLAALFLSFLCFVRLEFNYKRLLVVRTSIGGQVGRWKPVFADFVRIWGATLGVFLLSLLAVAIVATGAIVLAGVAGGMLAAFKDSKIGVTAIIFAMVFFFVGIFAMFLAASPALAFREARMFQLKWNNIGAGHLARFRCELKAGSFVWLRIKNILLGLITFGLYRPFARVAEFKMKAESVTLFVKGDLDQLVGQLEAQQEQGGFGDAVADAMGLDLIG